MDVKMVPWGNAYFNTSTCGRAEYDRAQLDCYRQLCRNNSAADCFSGQALCQHGPSECFGNRMQSCVVLSAPFPDWVQFMTCYGTDGDLSAAKAEECASINGLDYSQLAECAVGATGEQIDVANAKATVAYTGTWHGTPTVTVAGVTVEDAEQDNNLLNAVCETYRAGCADTAQGCQANYCTASDVNYAVSIPLGLVLLCMSLLGTAYGLQRLTASEDNQRTL